MSVRAAITPAAQVPFLTMSRELHVGAAPLNEVNWSAFACLLSKASEACEAGRVLAAEGAVRQAGGRKVVGAKPSTRNLAAAGEQQGKDEKYSSGGDAALLVAARAPSGA